LKKTIKPEGTEEKKTLSVTQGAGPIAQKGGKGPIATSSVTTSAIQPAQPAIMADPSIAAAWRELAKRFQATGENDKAIRAYENADKFEPGNAATLEALGALYAKSGQRDKVHQVWERLSQIDKARAEQFFSTYLRP
jgi:tetratricopeptide (TPR) repeat protein